MATQNFSMYCPPMAIYKVTGSLKRTAAEPMKVTFADGATLGPVTIPPTLVDRLGPLRWRVRACVGSWVQGTSSFTVSLPPEDCHLDLSRMTIIAVAITALVVYVDSSGKYWRGSVQFPDCPLDLFTIPMQAEAIIAAGTVSDEL